jgi:hypothetical protein
MSDVKQLLEQATPLPWRTILPGDTGWKARRYFRCVAFSTKRDEDYTTSPLIPADARLIVHAVNHLPDYEAAVDALERIARPIGAGYQGDVQDREALVRWMVSEARAALRRLRGES